MAINRNDTEMRFLELRIFLAMAMTKIVVPAGKSGMDCDVTNKCLSSVQGVVMKAVTVKIGKVDQIRNETETDLLGSIIHLQMNWITKTTSRQV